MTRLLIDAAAITANYRTVLGWVEAHGAALTVVTKALCGHAPAVEPLMRAGMTSAADSRIMNLQALAGVLEGAERWFLRPPGAHELREVVENSDVSTNTELRTVKELDRIAAETGRRHRVLLMIELGDLREGILPGELVKTYREVFRLERIDVIGIGSNLGCLSGAVPNPDQLMQLVLYRELLELKFERRIPLLSAGSSAMLPMLLQGQLPRQVNHFRVGEAILLGTDLINGGVLPGLRDDAFILEAEVVELKEKSLVPTGETSEELQPFPGGQDSRQYAPGERGYRAVIGMGDLDTEVGGLRPMNPDFEMAGSSSDLLVLNVGPHAGSLRIGDRVRFRPSYSSLVRLMSNRYTEKVMLPQG